MLSVLLAVAIAKTPSWVKEVDGTTEICAIPVEGDPETAEPPPLSGLQSLRRDRTLGDGAWSPPIVSTLEAKRPLGVSVETVSHPVKAGWSLARVEVGVPVRDAAIEQHITIAVDTTDSMYSATLHGMPLLQDEPPPERGSYRSVSRLELSREALHDLVDGLEGADRTVAFVAFRGGNAVELIGPTPVSDKAVLHQAIDRIRSENVGEDELFATLFRTAAKAFTACADDRVLMLTDDNPRFQGDPADVREGLVAWASQGLRLHTFAVASTADLTPIARLTVAGGGTLRRVDTMSEAASAFDEALRPTGAVLADASVQVQFDGAWTRSGASGTGVDDWDIATVLPSEWTGVRVYEVASPSVKVRVKATPLLTDEGEKEWTAATNKAGAWTEGSVALRHAAAYTLAELALREPATKAAVAAALEAGVREVGPGREAQALLSVVK